MNSNFGLSALAKTFRFTFVPACLVLTLLAQTSSARLGSFTDADGYYHFLYPHNTYNWSDVTYYNAGQSGANAGGGGPVFIAPDTGLWRLLSNNGAFFDSTTARNAYTSGAPPYPVASPPALGSGGSQAYLVGAHFPGRNFDDDNLAIRNDMPAGTGPVIYDYYIDQYDMGVTPASVTSGTVDVQFYFMPTQAVPDLSGAKARDKFTLSFVDTSGDIGVQWGYTFENEVYWRTNTSGPWNYTSIIANDQPGSLWDGIKMSIDLTNDTFGFDYFDDTTDTWTNVVPTGTSLGTPMSDLTRLRWQLEDDDHSPYAGKNYFDDFSFTVVPEPASAVLVGLAAIAGIGLRRRQRSH